jgi:predicted regulator of Ras-like GTPase activity (Roadblock/LC7/MglB family)
MKPKMTWSAIWRSGRPGADPTAAPGPDPSVSPGSDPSVSPGSDPSVNPGSDPSAPFEPYVTSEPYRISDPYRAFELSATSGPPGAREPEAVPATPRHLALPVAAPPGVRPGADLVPADLLPPGPGGLPVPTGREPFRRPDPRTGPERPAEDRLDPGPDPAGPDPSLRLLAICDPRIPAELRDLRQRMPGIGGALVATIDGAVLAHDPPGAEVYAAGRVALALLAQGQQATVTLGRGRFRNSVIWGTDGYLAVYAVGTQALLLVQATSEARVGRLHVEARRSGTAIAALLAPA